MSLVADKSGVREGCEARGSGFQWPLDEQKWRHERRRRVEVLRPPTRSRLILGRERTFVSCALKREPARWLSLIAVGLVVAMMVVGTGFWVSALIPAGDQAPASVSLELDELGHFISRP